MVVLELTNGNTIESDSEEFMAGDYVLVMDPDGKELGMWEAEEWQDEPQLVMGAILRCANGD